MSYGLYVPSGVLGEEQTFEIVKLDSTLDYSGYNATVTYKCGNFEGTIVSKTSKSEISWTPPIELAEANTTGSYVYLTFTVTTYLGTEEIRQRSVDVVYSIPSSVAPTFTVDFADESGYKDIFGDFIQLRSRLKIKVNPKEAYGAGINSYRIAIEDQIFTAQESVANVINSSGSIQVYVSVQDTRGRLVEESFNVYFRAYSFPAVTLLTVKRCDQYGNENDQGEYIQVNYSAKADSLDGKNTVSYKLEYKESANTSFNVVNLSHLDDIFAVSGGTYTFAADTGSSYDVQLTITDSFGSVVKTAIASTAATIMHFKASGNGIGLGKVSEVDNAVDVGWQINMNDLPIKNLADPENEQDAATKKYVDSLIDLIYPVGTIYTSTVFISPASRFGGTWEQIRERFLFAANDYSADYAIGKQGGEEKHTLTKPEMPSHTHPLWANAPGRNTVENTYGEDFAMIHHHSERNDYVLEAGGDEPHNNMPPYVTVYMWKRTA